jgi:hypothetical protein
MLAYTTPVFHKLKQFIWTQLKLGYTWNKFMTNTKNFGGHEQMRLNRWPMMISHNQDIAYLDQKHKEEHLALAHKPSALHSITGLCSSWWCFLFLGCRWNEWDLGPFQLSPTQLQAMLQFGHNGLISMDATFGTNDVKYHSFTLMAFDFIAQRCQLLGLSQVGKHVRTWWSG